MSLVGAVFRDKKGKIVIGQSPNASATLWMVASVLKLLFAKNRKVRGVADVLAVTASTLWAVEELTKGVNYFRRGIGLGVLFFDCFPRIHALVFGKKDKN